jgi:hypothetical protein
MATLNPLACTLWIQLSSSFVVFEVVTFLADGYAFPARTIICPYVLVVHAMVMHDKAKQ